MKEKIEFPQYRQDKWGIYCFQGPTKMYSVRPVGTNTNPGVTVDHYITRKMFLKHWGTGSTISEEKFISLYKKLFEATLQNILM